MISIDAVVRRRLANQRLTRATLRSPAEVVSWMAAVQAQDLSAALWGVGLRLARPALARVEQAYDDGAILRTHVMRPTWHCATPDDLGWLLDLTAPRVQASLAFRRRWLGLDADTLSRGMRALERALAGGTHLTREELAESLGRAGVEARRERLGHLLAHAELEQLVVSGRRRGKQVTYALFGERVPSPRRLSREEALAELAGRYFASHGPATLRDFAWWSGLTMREARLGMELARPSLASERAGELTFWLVPGRMPAARDPSAHLLPAYDEYLIAYQDRDAVIGRPRGMRNLERDRYGPQIVVEGRLAGSWRVARSGREPALRMKVATKLPTASRIALDQAAEDLRRFLGLPPESSSTGPRRRRAPA